MAEKKDKDYLPNNNEIKNRSKKITIIGVIVLIIILGAAIYATQKMKYVKAVGEDYASQKASEQYSSTISTADLEINWSYRVNDDYIYIDGIVANKSSTKDINYYEIGADFYDSSGNQYDTDWTHGSNLNAGKSQVFQIKHMLDPKFSSVKLYDKKVD